MRIRIKENGQRNISLLIPNFLVANRLTAWLISRNSGNTVTYRQIWRLLRTFRKFRRKNGKWKLVEVRSAEGDEVDIIV